MTDYPRFERVKGNRDRAHEAYHGGPLVTLFFGVVDAWLAYPSKGDAARLSARHTEIEVHERPLALARAQPASADPAPSVRRSAPEETFSDAFLLGSARTMKLQAGVLTAIAALLVLLVSQGLTLPERPRDQTARNEALSKAAIKKARDDNGPVKDVVLIGGPGQFDR